MKTLKTLMEMVCLFVFVGLTTSCDKETRNLSPQKPENSAVLTTETLKSVTSNAIPIANYYVSLNGNDSYPGTIEKPFKTIEKAWSLVKPGQLIFIRGGKYPLKNKNAPFGLKLQGKSGSSGNYIKIWAYPGERVELNCSSMTINYEGPEGLSVGSYGKPTDSNYLHIKGFHIKNTPNPIDPATSRGINSCGIRILASFCIIENCSSSGNGGPGFEIDGKNNQIINCDSYNNYDPNTWMYGSPDPGENADGFLVSNENQFSKSLFKGCRSWNNSDDGFDTYGTEGMVEISNCWSFHNGYIPGTETGIAGGNGFKLGKTNKYSDIRRVVSKCISTLNYGEGFMQNEGLCGMNIFNNTSFKNRIEGYSFSLISNVTLKNNISVDPYACYAPYANQINNSWNLASRASISDFISTDSKQLLYQRKIDGSLPVISFLKLKSTSPLTGLGAL